MISSASYSKVNAVSNSLKVLKCSRRALSIKMAAVNVDQLKSAKNDLVDYMTKTPCTPLMVRLAWHDAGTYNKNIGVDKWPQCGGANGSIRFKPEIGHGANAGLDSAAAMLEEIKAKYPEVTYADLYQMASAVGIEIAGGPKIPMQYGRVDATGPDDCVEEGRLPDGDAPFGDGAANAQTHLRNVFHRMGFTDQEITALSGAHTVGRAHKSRSGACRKESTKYTADGPGTKGGQSWTKEWLKFDNSYFVELKEQKDEDLLVLDTDGILMVEEGFKPHAEKYAADQGAFFSDYALAHAKLSELGVKWQEGGPVKID